MLKAALAAGLLVLASTSAHARHFYDRGHIVSHPHGCPRTAFCGCGVSVRVYGHPVRNLYLARNWRRFPHVHAAAGMVAVWPDHVAYIESVKNGVALLYDPNSGGHLTRMHRASLAGAIVVDPHPVSHSVASKARRTTRVDSPHEQLASTSPAVPSAIPTTAGLSSDEDEAIAWSDHEIVYTEHRPRRLMGKLEIADASFDFVSGGHGWSIPYGHWQITPQDVGNWGKRHGALGISGDTLFDRQLHRDRDGIEIHAQSHAATAGCVGIRSGFSALKAKVLAMIDKFGAAWLHISPTAAAITPSKLWAPETKTVSGDDGDDDYEPRRHHIAHYNHHAHRYAHHLHHLKHYARA